MVEEEDEDEGDDDDIEMQKAQNLVFGTNSLPLKRGKDPDFPLDGEVDPFSQPVQSVKESLDDLYTRLEHLDTNYDILEERFNSLIESKAMEIEQVDPQELGEKEA